MKKLLLTLLKRKLSINILMLAFLFVFAVSKSQVSTVLIPYTGSTSIPCGQTSLIQAHNGAVGTYSNNANGFVVIDAGFAAAITIVGTYTTEANFDYVRIFNGTGTGGTMLGNYNGQNGTFTFVGTPGQTITVQFISDGSVVYAGFNLNVTFNGPCFATPCSGTPASNTIIGAPTNICPAMNTTMALNTQYQVGGIQYQWYESTVSNVGPFTPVAASATLNSLVSATLATTTWYMAVITCTNSNQSFSTTSQEITVAGQTTLTVPYYESFEGIQVPNMLPNCSWSAANLGNTVRTFTAAQSNNRIARTGSKYAFYTLPSTNNNMYSNGIYMEPGITYSAGLFYSTEYFGYSNWSSLSLSVGPNQNATGQINLASTSPAVSGPYKELGGTFTVPSAGLYYLNIRASGSTGSALYLMIDDISVTIPCTPSSGNTPTVSASVSNATICAGDAVAFSATGADTYSWNTGATSSNFSDSPQQTMVYTVVGTNTLTGCSTSQTVSVMVNPSPTVTAFASSPEICPGDITYLSAIGADSYAWSNSSIGTNISVSPNATTSYSVIGTKNNGCSSTGVINVVVKQAPTINAVNPNGPTSCVGEAVTLTANGGVTYTWFLSSKPNLYAGNPVSVVLTSNTTFTVVGTASNGCSAKTTVIQNVEICEGISEVNGGIEGLQVYPNPTTDAVTVKVNSGAITGVEIVDVTGRVVLSSQGGDASATLDLSALGNGIYFAKVTTQDSAAVVRIVKN